LGQDVRRRSFPGTSSRFSPMGTATPFPGGKRGSSLGPSRSYFTPGGAMPREAGRNPSFSDPSILLPKHRDVPFPLGPRRVPSTGPFPSQPPRGRLGAGAADQAENLVQHISGKGWQNRSPASPTGHIPSLEAFPKEYLRIPLHRDAVLRSGHHGPLESVPSYPMLGTPTALDPNGSATCDLPFLRTMGLASRTGKP
jgi:hypothetical protein